MWVCSSATRPGSRPSAASGANWRARSGVQPTAVSESIMLYICNVICALTARLLEHPQHLGDAPGLRDAAARHVGRLGVEDLADRSHAAIAEMPIEAAEQAARAGAILRVRLQPGVDERSDQPRPHRALVI